MISISSGRLSCSRCSINWCSHLDASVSSGDDANFYYPGIHLDVPIFPTNDIYVQIELEKVAYSESIASIICRYTNEIGGTRRVNLGLWSDGEGTRVLRSIVFDFVRAQSNAEDFETLEPKATLADLKTQCPFSGHFSSLAELSRRPASRNAVWIYCWNIYWERCCTVCYEESSNAGASLGSISDLTDTRRTSGDTRRTTPRAPVAPIRSPRVPRPVAGSGTRGERTDFMGVKPAKGFAVEPEGDLPF